MSMCDTTACSEKGRCDMGLPTAVSITPAVCVNPYGREESRMAEPRMGRDLRCPCESTILQEYVDVNTFLQFSSKTFLGHIPMDIPMDR